MRALLRCSLAFVFILFHSFAENGATTPYLEYSDLVSGPAAGGRDNLGAIITVFGAGFGGTQEQSSISLAGVQLDRILQWTDHKIIFQIDSTAKSGEVRVRVNGRMSNSLSFHVNHGDIHFVSAKGNDNNSGSFTAPWRTISKAAYFSKPGDITYVLDGAQQTTLDNYHAALSIQISGQPRASIALVAYPGAHVVIGDVSGPEFGIRTPAIHNGPFSHWVIAGFTIRGGNTAMKLDRVDGWRIVNNDFSCPSGDGSAACVEIAGSSGIAFLGNVVHDAGRPGSSKRYQSVYFTTDTNHVEVAWNTITHSASCRGIQFHSSPVSSDSGFNQFDLSIHDNKISGQTCDGLNLATIDPSKGHIAVFNNLIYHVGTGPNPPDGESSYACINSPGIVNRGLPGSGSVEIFNNTLADCGSQRGPSAVALNVGKNSPVLEFKHNSVYQCAGQPYLTPGSEAGRISEEGNVWQGSGQGPQQTSVALSQASGITVGPYSGCALPQGAASLSTVDCRVDHDINGTPRDLGGKCAVGAYE